MELSDLNGVGEVTEQRLKEAGIETINQLAKSDGEAIAENSGMSEGKASKLVSRAKEQGIVIQTGEEVQEEYDAKRHITTGMEQIDDVLDGGWREGDVVALGGASGSGKTQISFHSCVRAVEATDEPAIYIETEPDRYSPKRLKQFVSDGHDPEAIQNMVYRVPAHDLEQQELAYKRLRKQLDSASLVVLDSFSANFRGDENFEDRSGYQDRATATTNHIAALRALAKDLHCPALTTAQVYADPTRFGPDEAIYGGPLFYHNINYLVYLKDGQGAFTSAQILNHYELPELEFQINIGSDELEAMQEE